MSTFPPLVAGIFREGKLLRLAELPDPREAYCASFTDPKSDQTCRPLDNDEIAIARKLLAERTVAHV